MEYTENAINILTTKTFRGVGRAWIVKNLNNNLYDGETIVALLNKTTKDDCKITLSDFESKKDVVIKAIRKLEGFMDGVIAVGDADFPQYRGSVKNSEQPIFLFYRGDISLLRECNKNVAVIGLLNPDENIIEIEKIVVSELVNNNVTIISGLALGCDTVAHKQALDLNGKTVAILPSPLNNIMPASNKGLAHEIFEKKGLLVTEYLTDAKSKMELGGRYQDRDRLQALFSDSIVLSASFAKNDQGNDSGSRLAMEYAHNYSIPQAVIYDPNENANNPKYDLNRQCINNHRNIIIINKNNIKETVKRIIETKLQEKQRSLFD